MPKVLIPHSWSYNMGDAAMLLAMSDMMRRVSTGSEVAALVSHPQFTRERCAGIKAEIEGWPWPVPEGKPSFFDLARYPVVFLANMFSALLYRAFRKKVFILNSEFSGPMGRFFDCDVVISPGGDFIGPNYVFMTTFGEFMMARILGKKLVIMAQTMGPFKGMLNGTLAGLALRLPNLIVVRENRTAADLKKIGINAVVTADLAFTFPKASGVAKNRKGVRVIICPKKIGRGREAYCRSMRMLAEKIAGLGCEIVFMPTDKYDVDFHKEIASGLDVKHEIISEVKPPEDIARIIANSDFVVSSRMHAIILGTLSSTPFVAIGDSFKFSEILEPLCRDCTIGVSELDENIEGIAARIVDRERLRKSIGENFPSVRERALRNESILAEKFGEWGF